MNTFKSHVIFNSDSFPSYDPDGEVNPGIFGKRLAEFLIENLENHGVLVEEMIAEDWGYFLPITNKEFDLSLCVVNRDGTRNSFLCWIEPVQPYLRKWFRKISTVERVTEVKKKIERNFAVNAVHS